MDPKLKFFWNKWKQKVWSNDDHVHKSNHNPGEVRINIGEVRSYQAPQVKNQKPNYNSKVHLVRKWQDDMQKMEKQHAFRSLLNKIIGIIISHTSIILSGATGIVNLITGKNQILPVVIGALGIISSILMNIYREHGFHEKAQNHNLLKSEYHKLRNEIHMHFNFENSHGQVYTNIDELMKQLRSAMTRLDDRSVFL